MLERRARGPAFGIASLACAAVVVTFLWIGTRLANQPYDGPHEDNAAAFMGSARNHLRYGFSRTLGHDLQEPGTGWYGDRSIEHRYLHHPPGLSLTLAGAMAIFGDSHAVGRLTALSFHLFSLLAVLYGAYHFIGGWWAAALAGALFTLTPLSAYYGRSVSFQVFTLPFLLWSQLLLLLHRETDRQGFRTAAILIACIGCLYDWDIYFWILVASVYEVLSPPRGSPRWRAAFAWAVAGASMFAVVVTQIVLIQGSANELLGVMLRWIDGGAADLTTPVEAGRVMGWSHIVFRWTWFVSLGRLTLADFTAPVVIAAGAFALASGVRLMRGERAMTDATRLVVLSSAPGLLYLFAIPAALGHEYGLMPLSAGVCWAATAAIFRITGRSRIPVAALTVLCVVWVAGPWVEMWFGACFAPYRIVGRCDRPISFPGFGRITYRSPPRGTGS